MKDLFELLYEFTITDALNLPENQIWDRAKQIVEDEAPFNDWNSNYVKLNCTITKTLNEKIYHFEVIKSKMKIIEIKRSNI